MDVPILSTVVAVGVSFAVASPPNKHGARTGTVPAKRVNDSALGVLERPALTWMAERLPSQVTPDHLTAVGFLGALLAAAGYLASRWAVELLWVWCVGLVG